MRILSSNKIKIVSMCFLCLIALGCRTASDNNFENESKLFDTPSRKGAATLRCYKGDVGVSVLYDAPTSGKMIYVGSRSRKQVQFIGNTGAPMSKKVSTGYSVDIVTSDRASGLAIDFDASVKSGRGAYIGPKEDSLKGVLLCEMEGDVDSIIGVGSSGSTQHPDCFDFTFDKFCVNGRTKEGCDENYVRCKGKDADQDADCFDFKFDKFCSHGTTKVGCNPGFVQCK